MSCSRCRYVVITPAHNEVENIAKTIQSMVAQTVLPVRWVIVSDRSVDGTDEVILKYAREHSFIAYVRKAEGEGRHVANKVGAINLAIENLRDIQYDYIGNLDADVAFSPGYFEFLLQRFEENPDLGIAGGRIHLLQNGKLKEQKSSEESVAGAVQLFRRACFEAIGGYKPLRGGFEDGLAELSARLEGWTTRSYPQQVVVHYGEVGTAARSILRFRFDSGLTEFRLGFSYSYHLVRSLYYLFSRPVVIGTLTTLLGYIWGCVTLRDRLLRPKIVRHLRDEQKKRLHAVIRRLFGAGA